MDKKKLTGICVFFISSFFMFSQSFSVDSVNRRTAVRCLKLAESYLSSGDFGNALAQSELGLNYDDSVADLWYVKAAAKSGLGESKADVLPLVMKSITEGEWVDYNRDGARVLYADLLCDTGNYVQAIAILDSKPFVYSADAEFIRVKSYYCMRTEESIIKARDKVNSARKIYPSDVRFPHIFFKYEYDLHRLNNAGNIEIENSNEVLVKKIIESFIAKMPEYDNPDAELEIYAAYFAEGERRKRMIQAFAAHGMKHPLYAIVALQCNLISQLEASDYFCSFADNAVSSTMLEDFISLLTDDIAVKAMREHLNVYSGVLSIDTDYDCNGNLFVKYSRGRPEHFFWDANNDGINEWDVKCDFGVPEELNLTQGNIQLTYGKYPSIVKAVYKSERLSEGLAVFNLMDEVLDWTPVNIVPFEAAKKSLDIDFFVPLVKTDTETLDENMILYNCSSYEIASSEREGAKIVFKVLNGFPQSAAYYSYDKIYAHAFFEDGFPSVRSVDNDDDGIFEILETFGYDPENSMNRNIVEQEQVMTNLFGLPVAGSGIYLKMIQIDYNGDTVPDFTEEYLANEGKISSWDYDGDRVWNVRYKKYPRENPEEPLIEDSQFFMGLEKSIVTVTSWNKIPVKVQIDDNFLPVTQGENKCFYWIGQAGVKDDETYILENFDLNMEQGCTVLLENSRHRIQVVRIEHNIFGYILPTSNELDVLEVLEGNVEE